MTIVQLPNMKEFLKNNKDRHYTQEECDYFNEALSFFVPDNASDEEKRSTMLYIVCAYDSCERELKSKMIQTLREDLKELKKTNIL